MAHEEWVERAEKDFEAAQFNRENGFDDIAAFLYQQAVEKSLKGVLIAQGRGLERTHDCFALA
jgi:HEPN domain-containing protein